MPMIVEDGTGVTGANSYSTVQAADDYFALFGGDAWTALTVPQKETALVRATQYIELVWSKIYPGTKFKETQGLGYPRLLCCHDTTPSFPAALVSACAEYAVRASAGPLAPDLEYDASGRQPTMKMEKVGPLEEETRWANPTGLIVTPQFRPYPVPDSLMRSFLPAGGVASGRVIR